MTMKQCYATITGGILKLPDEMLEILPQDIPIHIYTDSEKGTVTLFAKDPAERPSENKWYFEEMTEILGEENWEEYSRPCRKN